MQRYFYSVRPGIIFLLFSLFANSDLYGQCNANVTHASGTQTVSCTNVTVTSAGSVSWGPLWCGTGPYFLNSNPAGSYTFNFNPAIPGVKVSLYAVNNTSGGVEEVAFHVNGSFYPITIPGVAAACQQEAMITPSGTIGCCTNCGACSWDDIVIMENMTSLKVEEVYFNGFTGGVAFSLSICCPVCLSDAGVITDEPHTACVGTTVNIAPATQTFLDNDDLLQYILFSNPADPFGSVIATSNTPSFSFNPVSMQAGVTYYVAAIAGNNVGGNVDLTDFCLDISNAIPVVWHPLPAVTFTVSNPNVCAGACTTVTAAFTGTAPFTLTYTTPASGPVTQTFSGSPATFQVCTAVGSPPGNLVVQATNVTDAWCVCE